MVGVSVVKVIDDTVVGDGWSDVLRGAFLSNIVS